MDAILKRLFDFIAALLGLIVLSPLLMVVAVAIKLTSPGPVLHRARRVGMQGKLFTLYKFRSMVIGAGGIGPGITSKGDARITPTGRFLRNSKLDELPQLINVLKGEMSLVGPRPEDPRYVAQYTADQRAVLSVRPGITSAASVLYRHEEQLLTGQDWEQLYLTEIMPRKIKTDLEYLSRRNLVSDIGLILRTFIAIGR
jgi:lipopolysaccharide/colanic/teichoic acid biosynthesis glycosyltransferase